MNNLVILMMGGGAQGAQGAQGGGIMNIVMMLAIVVVFYFFMIRPQMKKAKEQKKYIEQLKKGDKILTIGGIYGKIVNVNEDGTIIMEVEDGTKMKISKNAVSQDATNTLNQTNS
ncbi:MAG: preprotein translocase subunit YajC [Bacteroidetes bacterium]|nr:preprotein translocase subunit YajC [Bacteroidota bacterium]